MSEWFDNQEHTDEKVTPVTPPTDAPAPVSEAPAYEKPPYTAPAVSAVPDAPAEPDAPTEPAASAEPAAPAEQPVTDWRANPYTNAPSANGVPTPPPVRPTPANSWYRSGPMGGGTPTGNVPPQPPQPPQYNGWQTPPAPRPPQGGKKHTGLIVTLSVIGAVAILAMAVLLAFAIGDTVSDKDVSDTGTENSETINNNAPSLNITDWADDDGGLTAAQIIDKNLNSTVVISIYQMKSAGSMYAYGFGTQSLTQVGEGSGIIMSKDGYIITNWHVVTDEKTGKLYDKLNISTHDGKLYENAKVIGADQSTDLAVIKIDATDLTVAEFGDSSKLVMGARVLALGNAGGLQWSASQGIVSGLARDVYEDTGYSIKCLQTDAAINPGNSGGPLLNNQGQVIGINSAKIVASGYEGLGFSIPINEAKTIIDDLLKYGYVKGRVQLGITGYSVNSNGYQGFVIQSINDDSVLKSTKVQIGDLITAVDGVKITDYGTMRTQLAKHTAGDSITLTVLRLDSRTGAENTFTVTCKLGESKS